jgi:hypothetical protein
MESFLDNQKRFSVTILPNRVKLYKCDRDVFKNILLHFPSYDITKDVLCQMMLDNEITFYLYYKETDGHNLLVHGFFTTVCMSDQRIYHVIDIHEDVPGIDHIGIIHHLSRFFLEKDIPILYVNTYGHNLVFVAEEYMTSAMEILEKISYI